MKSLTTCISEFLLAQEADGSSVATVRWYKSMLTAYVNGMSDRRIGEVAAGDLRRYLVGLKSRDFADATISAHTRALHKFWAWAAKEYAIPNPMRNIRYPAKQQPKPRAADLDDIRLLFAAANVRDKAMIAFMLDTGCRAGGLCGLKVADVDLDEHRALVTEKGNKTRTVIFSSYTASLLRDWMNERQAVDVLFHSDSYEQLTPSGLYQMLRRLARRSGVKGRFNPHSLRHAFAKEYIRAGGDLATLAKLLGHRDVSTTVAHYTIFTDGELRAAHERYSPARRLKGQLDEA